MNTKKLLWAVAITGLILTILPSILTFSGFITMEQNKSLMTLGTILWLVTAPFILGTNAES